MAKGANQKLKILYLMKILLEETDETHAISLADIIKKLAAYDISAERKSLYSDMESLRLYGIDIIGEQRDRTYYYYIGNRQFELAELKFLVDSVQSAKFLTTKKSNELIKKIEGLASRHEAGRLQRQVYVAERVKNMNESIYYSVDAIHEAIARNKQIRFQYFQWNVNKEMELRRNGDFYQVSPWLLTCDAENYYLVAYDGEDGKIKHFRVDKMLRIESLEEKRQGKEQFKNENLAQYSKKMFGMFGGREERVKIRCENYLAGVIIDRFGKEVTMRREDEEHFLVTVNVEVSSQFLHWIMALGDGATILSPESVLADIHQELERLNRQYGEEIKGNFNFLP